MKRFAFAVVWVVAAIVAPVVHAATAQQAIARLNAQRAANGIPAGITENLTWSQDCALHNHYMATNHVLTHVEDPNRPAYTSGGAFAGKNAVLAQNNSWDAGNPYEYAPLHLDQLLEPRLLSVGSADSEGYSCTTTFPGLTRGDPSAAIVYTYPGDGTTIYASEAARESPWTPGSLVGIPEGTTTGPYLYVLADAPGQSPVANAASLSNATLTGPSGAVPVMTVDGNTPVPGGGRLAGYIAPGGFIIPTVPLARGATYHAHVVVNFAGQSITRDWTFKTVAPVDPKSSLSRTGGTLRFTSSSPAPVVATFTRANGAHAPSVTIAPGRSARLKLSPGRWRVCGHQSAAGGFGAFDRCFSVTVTGVPSLSLSNPRLRAGKALLTVRYSNVLRGRTATVTLTRLTIISCTRTSCRTRSGKSFTRRLRLTGTTLAITAPRKRYGWRVAMSTKAFTLRDAPWMAARARITFVVR